MASFVNRASVYSRANALARRCQSGRQRRIDDEEQHRSVAALALASLCLTWHSHFLVSLSLLQHNDNSLYAQPSRGTLVISASQFVSLGDWLRHEHEEEQGEAKMSSSKKRQRRLAKTKPPRTKSLSPPFSLSLSLSFLLWP